MYAGVRDLTVYQKAYALALDIYKESKVFPREEPYSLTDQIRRSSRSVAANLAEAWKRRHYKKAFVSKLIECSAEAAETEVWLDMAFDLGFLEGRTKDALLLRCVEIQKMIESMIRQPEKFCPS
jgi:four helix bundle protein